MFLASLEAMLEMTKNDDLDLNKLDELENQSETPVQIQPNKKRRSALGKYMENDGEKNKRERKVKPVSFAISYKLDEQIEQYCKRKYMKKSTFAVLALEEYLNKKL